MSPQYKFVTQRQLGQLFGVSSHVIGRWLIEVGLRTQDKKPSQRAYDEGLVQFVSDGDVRFWAWSKDAVTAILEQAGHKRATEALAIDVPSEFLVGPFIARRSDTEGDGDGFEIADVNGMVAIWVRGDWLAGVMVRLLNLCHRFGKWF